MMSPKTKQGFTLVELVVTVGIFAMITAVLLVRNGKFDDETLLQSTAYEIALSIRQAQNFGINVQGQGGVFDRPYGIYFESGTTSYVFFSDDPALGGEGYYNKGEEIETYTLGRGFSISRMCVTDGACSSDIGGGASVVFRRPDPEAVIKLSAEGKPQPVLTIVLSSPRGSERYIVVRQTGQIAVTKAPEDSPQQLPN